MYFKFIELTTIGWLRSIRLVGRKKLDIEENENEAEFFLFKPDPFCVNRFDSPELIFTRPFRIEFVDGTNALSKKKKSEK